MKVFKISMLHVEANVLSFVAYLRSADHPGNKRRDNDTGNSDQRGDHFLRHCTTLLELPRVDRAVIVGHPRAQCTTVTCLRYGLRRTLSERACPQMDSPERSERRDKYYPLPITHFGWDNREPPDGLVLLRSEHRPIL